MQNSFLNLKIVIIFCVSFLSKDIHAQLGFCQGNSGDPIFIETFGIGTTYGPQLPASTTTYDFVGFNGPQDGQYTIGSSTFAYGWNMPSDHTLGDINGKALIVNANSNEEEFYTVPVSGLCENTTYEFSAWLLNILPTTGCGGNGVPVNVRFEIWNITNTGGPLFEGATGNVFSSATPTWLQYGLVFTTDPGQTSVILKMINNAPSTNPCGNDLAIDDIVFKTCGNLIAVEDTNSNDSVEICSSQIPYSETITAVPDGVVFDVHFYQWQTSTDGINWVDVAGETNVSISVSGITTTTFYRSKVAEFAANLNDSDCLTFSDVYEIIANEAPIQPNLECWENATFNDSTCSWSVTGTQPLEPTELECWEVATFSTTTCSWEVTGTQPTQPTVECWESAIFNDVSCVWEVTGIQPEEPTGLDCWETTVFDISSCSWVISDEQPVQPIMECWQIASFDTTTCQWEIFGEQDMIFTEDNFILCVNTNGSEVLEPLLLETGLSDTNYSFVWFLNTTTELVGETNSSLMPTEGGTYKVIVTNLITGCENEDEMLVIESEPPATLTIERLTQAFAENHVLLATAEGDGEYEYSLDNGPWQEEGLFTNLSAGQHKITARDKNGCGSDFDSEFIVDYPKYFTPNDDGYNDTWNIARIGENAKIYIFDRYGKLLKQISPEGTGWDGTYNGNNMPTDGYWFTVEYTEPGTTDRKEFKDHFTLKR